MTGTCYYYYSGSGSYSYCYAGNPTWTINDPNQLAGLTATVSVSGTIHGSRGSGNWPGNMSAGYSASLTNSELLSGKKSGTSSNRYNCWDVAVTIVDVKITLTLSDGRVFTQQHISQK